MSAGQSYQRAEREMCNGVTFRAWYRRRHTSVRRSKTRNCSLLRSTVTRYITSNHRRSQGVHWVHVHLFQGERKFLQGKVVSAPPGRECTPRGRARVQFLEEIEETVGEVISVVLACVLRVTIKNKVVSLFWAEMCALPDKILATSIPVIVCNSCCVIGL